MQKLVLTLAFIVFALAQQPPKCALCQHVPNCPPELFSDGFVDPIFNFILQQVSPSGYPHELKRVASQNEANYTFSWKTVTYLAIVDLKTNNFKVVAIQQAQSVMDTQKMMGIREDINVSSASSDSKILSFVDHGLRSKFFPS